MNNPEENAPRNEAEFQPEEIPENTPPETLPVKQPQVVHLTAFHGKEQRKWMHYMTDDEKAVILARYAEGESLMKIAERKGVPAYQTILRHLRDDEEFGDDFEVARRMRAMKFEEEALEASDPANIDAEAKNGVAAAKLRIDTLKWGAAVCDKKRYGTQAVEVTQMRQLPTWVATGVPDNDNLKPPVLDETGKVVLNSSSVESTNTQEQPAQQDNKQQK